MYQLVTGTKFWEMLPQTINSNKVQVMLQVNMDKANLAIGAPVSACVLFLTIANIFLHQKSTSC